MKMLSTTLRNIKKIREQWLMGPEQRFPPDSESGLANPETRAEIPVSFPQTISPFSTEEAVRVIEEQLALRGTSLDEVKRINLAYPHKHPGLFPFLKNAAEESVQSFRQRLSAARPDVDWVIAAAICERVQLSRSEDQSSIYALTTKQVYDVYKPAQQQPLPFIEKGNASREYFVVVDWTIEQGTTIANLMSYIRHNGGDVLMAAADQHAALLQKRTAANDDVPGLSAAFNAPARNNGRVPELAKVFAASARREGKDWAPAECIDKFEEGLQKHGNSIFALTDGECARLIKTIEGEYFHKTSFPGLLDGLDKPVKRRQPKRLTAMFG